MAEQKRTTKKSNETTTKRNAKTATSKKQPESETVSSEPQESGITPKGKTQPKLPVESREPHEEFTGTSSNRFENHEQEMATGNEQDRTTYHRNWERENQRREDGWRHREPEYGRMPRNFEGNIEDYDRPWEGEENGPMYGRYSGGRERYGRTTPNIPEQGTYQENYGNPPEDDRDYYNRESRYGWNNRQSGNRRRQRTYMNDEYEAFEGYEYPEEHGYVNDPASGNYGASRNYYRGYPVSRQRRPDIWERYGERRSYRRYHPEERDYDYEDRFENVGNYGNRRRQQREFLDEEFPEGRAERMYDPRLGEEPYYQREVMGIRPYGKGYDGRRRRYYDPYYNDRDYDQHIRSGRSRRRGYSPERTDTNYWEY